MAGFFEQICNLNPNADNYLFLVTDGPRIGEKVLISNGRRVFISCEDGFFASHDLPENPENGLHEIDGCTVYSEHIGNEKKVVICGAGHVAIAIEKLALMIGCGVTVIDDRPEFARKAREAGDARVICAPFEQALSEISGDSDTYFVIVTRGHQWDIECLRAILAKPYGYIGLMGSKRRVAIVKEMLEKEGTKRALLDSVHMPIGLKIGAETPEEIAVSVIAEIIDVKNRQEQKIGYPSEITNAIFGLHRTEVVPGKNVIATIIRRRGSAPRKAGTKMLIRSDGSLIGTIGGGCVEAEIIAKARRMIQTDLLTPVVMHVDLTAEAAANEGEVCGGTVDVFLEEAGAEI